MRRAGDLPPIRAGVTFDEEITGNGPTKMNVYSVYFSPTGTTERVVAGVARELARSVNGNPAIREVDFTLPAARAQASVFEPGDLVVLGLPVYAGRVPNVLLKYLASLVGNGAHAVAVTLYGNRNYDDALVELADILGVQGFAVIAAGAFIGEHSFSKILAAARPDGDDMALVESFARQVAAKLSAGEDGVPDIAGQRPYRPYYVPRDENGQPADIRKVKPLTSADCNGCLTCVTLCPMGSIDEVDPTLVKGVCIKCGACIKGCPTGAKYYDDEAYLRHKRELEIEFATRREPELFL